AERRGAPAAPRPGPPPRQPSLEPKRFNQIIVGAAVESGDFVLHSIARCQQQNGSCHSAFADAGEYLKAITAGKHHIQKNDVKLFRIDTKKSILSRMRNNRLVSLSFKAFLQGIGDFDLIFDYKNTHALRLLAVGAVYMTARNPSRVTWSSVREAQARPRG